MESSTKKFFAEHLTSRQAWLVLIGYILATVIIGVLLAEYFDRDLLRGVVNRNPKSGIILFLIIEYLYILFVPIYNTPVHLAAGYIFGGNLGWLLNFVTTTGALLTIVALVKRYGRPLLNRVVPKHMRERYDRYVGNIGPIALFIVYVLPLFPDDEITYMLAASDRVNFWRFILPITLGNVTKAAVSYIGDNGSAGIFTAVTTRVVVLVAGLGIIGAQEYFFRSNKARLEN